MLIEKMVKRLLVLVCVAGLSACETTPEVVETVEPIETTETVETNTIVEPVISAEEKMRMESEEMRSARTVYFEFDKPTVQQQYLAVLELHASGQHVVNCYGEGTRYGSAHRLVQRRLFRSAHKARDARELALTVARSVPCTTGSE